MENIANQLSNVSLYDVKKYVRKAQNAVLNVTDMEAKVREATNNEPWGTSTTVMQQIADGTNNYQQFHEIMPFVYRRFSEKSASEWRQIYKSLQLLDFLVRNGSERVVDYARSHISVVEMLRHFSYIDSKGVDRGASIRKRSEELVDLLNSNKKLRAERKQAKQLNAKTASLSSAGGSRFGGFGSPAATGVYANPEFTGDQGGFGGSGSKYGGFSSETYYRQRASASASGSSTSLDPPQNDEFEEYEVTKTTTQATDNGDDDDDFADFQSASTPAPSATKPATSNNILDLFDAPAPQTSAAPAGHATQFTSPLSAPAPTTTIPAPSQASAASPAPAKPAPSMDLFDSLWESSKSYTPKTSANTKTTGSNLLGSLGDAGASKRSDAPAPAPASNATKASNGQSDITDLLSF